MRFHGKCTCGAVQFDLTDRPLFIHACHCTWCQRETGGPHAVNAMIESACVQVVAGEPVAVETPSNSGKGQVILRCPECHVALWSHYAGGGRDFAFVRVGVLEERAALAPDIHIFTSTKAPWYVLPDGVPAMPEYYDRKAFWPDWALARRAAVLAAKA